MSINYWEKLEVGNTYHVYNRGINACNLFYKEENYDYFLKKWKHYFQPFLNVYAYCLMPNHFHFVVAPKEEFWLGIENLNVYQDFPERPILQKRLLEVQSGQSNCNDFLELQFKDFLGGYAKAINKQENRDGSLIKQRFKRVCLRTSERVASQICYTHHNPIHHGFCTHYSQWKHSSYHAFVSSKSTNIMRNDIFNLFEQINGDCESGRDSFFVLHEEYRKNFHDEKCDIND